jgi:hypothetical protein
MHSYALLVNQLIINYNHRCTRVGNPGEGIALVFDKIPMGVGSRLSGKIARRGPPISGLIAFLLTSILRFAWAGPIFTPSPYPLTPTVSFYDYNVKMD